MTLLLLPFFGLKETWHYTNPPNSCNPFQSLPSCTTAGVVKKLELVVTVGINFIFTGISAESCGNVVTLSSLIPLKVGSRNIHIISFSIREKLAFFSKIFPKGLQTLRFLPSVLYKNEGRG